MEELVGWIVGKFSGNLRRNLQMVLQGRERVRDGPGGTAHSRVTGDGGEVGNDR